MDQQLLLLSAGKAGAQHSFPGEKCDSLKQGNEVPESSEKLKNKTQPALLSLLRALSCVAWFGFLRIHMTAGSSLVLYSLEGQEVLPVKKKLDQFS